MSCLGAEGKRGSPLPVGQVLIRGWDLDSRFLKTPEEKVQHRSSHLEQLESPEQDEWMSRTRCLWSLCEGPADSRR